MLLFEAVADTGIHITLSAAVVTLVAKEIWAFTQSRRNDSGTSTSPKGEMRESLVANKLDVIATKLDAQTSLLNELVINSRVEAELRKRSGA